VFVLPFFTLVWALLQPSAIGFFLSAGCITLILLHRLILAIWFRWNPAYAFTHPIGVLWFQWLGLVKIYDYITKRKVPWKGRDV
jgi:chlorobactene glucosyltransferase